MTTFPLLAMSAVMALGFLYFIGKLLWMAIAEFRKIMTSPRQESEKSKRVVVDDFNFMDDRAPVQPLPKRKNKPQ